jgi:TonB-linked SusC/RagA family outer membrane protein
MRKLLLLLMACVAMTLSSWAQRTVTGKVTDEKGNPIPNVSVLVKGTTTGTSTAEDGTYSLTVPGASGVLVFTAVGMDTREVSIGSSAVIDASMMQANRSMSEVVVTALGVRREKRSLGYAVTELKSEDLTKVPNQNLLNSLNGKVPGLQVTSSGGAPGMASRVVIRGGSKSLRSAGNEPLFVIDGVPVTNANDGNFNTVTGAGTPNRIGDINPEDIESMSILKGSAASVLYGNRGANGVVLITTKSGKTRAGKPVVNFSSTYGVDDALKLPEYQTTFAQGQLVGGVPTYAEGTSISFGPRITGQTVTSTAAGGPVVLQAFDPRADFLKKGQTFNNNLSLSQSTERGSYFLSLGHSTQSSIVPNQEYNKANFRFNTTNNLTNKLSSTVNLSYVRSWGDVPYTGQDGNNPFFALFGMPVTWNINGYGYEYPDGRQKNFRGGSFDNPLWSVNRTFFNTVADRFIGNVNFSYKALSWLDLTYKFGSDVLTDHRKSFKDLFTGGNPNGYLVNDNVFRQGLTSTFIANINKRINSDLGLSLLLGQDFNQNKIRQINQTATAITLPHIAHMSNGKTFDPDVEFLSNQRLIGAFADLKFDFRNYLFLGITGRNEWSSTLPADNRSYFYPGVNASFVFSDAFQINRSILDYGKIRAGYAKTARDAPAYQVFDIYTSAAFGDGFTPGITFPFNSIAGYTVSNTIRNPKLEPEFTKEFEVGAELRFLQNRLRTEFTYFNNVNDNGIVAVQISPATGATNAVVNSGEIKNKGFEVALGGTPVKTNSFSWDVNLTFSRIRSLVVETYPGVERVSQGGFSGNPAIFAIKGERFGSIVGQKLRRDADGNVLVNPTTGRPLFDDGGNLGYIEPDWTGGLRSDFTFKSFSLDILFDTRQGGYILNATEDLLDGYGVSKKTESRELDFIYPGVRSTDGKTNDKVVKRDQSWWSSAKVNEEYLYENNWTKLREVNLGYTFTVPNNSLLKNVNIGVYGRNLYLWTKIPHIDPESSSFGTSTAQGVSRMAFPSTRSMGVNLKFTF